MLLLIIGNCLCSDEEGLMVLCIILVEDFDFVIFGVMGDLVYCKILLGLYCCFVVG